MLRRRPSQLTVSKKHVFLAGLIVGFAVVGIQ